VYRMRGTKPRDIRTGCANDEVAHLSVRDRKWCRTPRSVNTKACRKRVLLPTAECALGHDAEALVPGVTRLLVRACLASVGESRGYEMFPLRHRCVLTGRQRRTCLVVARKN
jgi:hypothetical protein